MTLINALLETGNLVFDQDPLKAREKLTEAITVAKEGLGICDVPFPDWFRWNWKSITCLTPSTHYFKISSLPVSKST